MKEAQKSPIKKLEKQPYPCGTRYGYSYNRKYREQEDRRGYGKTRGRLFVFDKEKETVEKLFGLEGAVRFEEKNDPGEFEFETINIGTEEDPKYVFVKGHPYQAMIALHRIVEEIEPETENYKLIPLRQYFGTHNITVTEFLDVMDLSDLSRYYLSISECEKYLAGLDSALELAESERYKNYWERLVVRLNERDELVYLRHGWDVRGTAGYIEREVFALTSISISHFLGYKTAAERKETFMEAVEREKRNTMEDKNNVLEELRRYGDAGSEDTMKIIKRKFETAADQLLDNLEKAGRKLRISHHVDPRRENVFFRGVNNDKLLLTIIDQYHCGEEESAHHERKYGGGPILRMG